MIQSIIINWILTIFGVITFIPLLVAQLIMILQPNSQKTKDLIIGKGEDWRDKSHFKYSLAFAWADWVIIFPLFCIGVIGVFNGQLWGYISWFTLGIVSIYFSIVFWLLEKEYTMSSYGPLVYFTYFWGFILYWGIAAVIYSILHFV